MGARRRGAGRRARRSGPAAPGRLDRDEWGPLRTAEQAKDRLQQSALAGRLEPSEGHRPRSLNPRSQKDPHRSVESFRASLRQAPAGVGSGVTQWLLPLVLLENEPARRYAVPIQRAVQHHPDLFPISPSPHPFPRLRLPRGPHPRRRFAVLGLARALRAHLHGCVRGPPRRPSARTSPMTKSVAGHPLRTARGEPVGAARTAFV